MFRSLLLGFMLLGFNLFAHPVIWKGGSVFTLRHLPRMKRVNLHHSLTHRWALGLHIVDIQDKKLLFFQNNFLLKRFNKPSSQANIYGFIGLGLAPGFLKDENFHLGLQGDWESRRYYTQFNVNSFFYDKIFVSTTFRFGVAPYVEDYDGFHTWIIFQANQDIFLDDSTMSSSMLVFRFFMQNYLIELGSDFKGLGLMTFMVHF